MSDATTPAAPAQTPHQRQKEITDKIQAAQFLINEAARLACPLGGWCDQWEDIGRTSDAIEALWWRIHQAPPPGEPVPL